MLRQTDIAAAFRESILRSSKGFQYIHTRDFVTALRLRGIHFSEVEANSWIAREQTYFVDKTPDHSENRLWMMAGMGRGSDGIPFTRDGLRRARLSVNTICNVGPNTLLFERSGGYVVLDISLKPKQGARF